ncbi:MAG: right-handed parallel beta-helix repeat-containing protein [Planctomycetota bacterium]|jgi:hypothetical protein
MRLSVRWGRGDRTLLFSLLIGLCAPGLSAARDTNAPADRNEVHFITVDSLLGRVTHRNDITTLPDALARAADDPRINIIRFDPKIFPDRSAAIQLAEPIVIQGKNAGRDCIDGGAVKNGVILDLSACPDAGIVVGSDGELTLRRLTVWGSKQQAIMAKGHSRLVMEQVVIKDAGISGLALFGRSSATALDCTFDSNGQWNAVFADHSRARLSRCSLKASRFCGIDLSGAAEVRLEDCNLEKGQNFGIFATGKANIELQKTRISRYGGRAVELQDNAGLTVSASRIENNADYGIILFGQSRIEATTTLVAGNAAHGASLRNQASGRFSDCTFVENRYSGIGCLDADRGGRIGVTRCRFQQNGMRPLYRGPAHICPMVPTPLQIDGPMVTCQADPHALIELYLDHAGEAARYLKTIPADGQGRFTVDCREVPHGLVMTALATVDGSTSEFNVIAGNSTGQVLKALLGRTGPLSDKGGPPKLNALLRRWRPGSQVVFNINHVPVDSVQRYMQFLVRQVKDWTAGAVSARLKIGQLENVPDQAMVIPVHYMPPDTPQLVGRGGVTYMKWDAAGFFTQPMEIMLAFGENRYDICPRVFAHEVGHTLGLGHVRVGLLSRMQGSVPPGKKYINDFSPMMTYYDVLALQILYDSRNGPRTTLQHLVERGIIPSDGLTEVAAVEHVPAQPTFSPR